jgi:hypothetical protein
MQVCNVSRDKRLDPVRMLHGLQQQTSVMSEKNTSSTGWFVGRVSRCKTHEFPDLLTRHAGWCVARGPGVTCRTRIAE